MQPMISIIVPVYNAESSLKRCIESVQNQTIKEYQLVLIDDGSKDRSLDICSQYAEKDSRITVIAQKNSGVSRARNSGLDAAIGTYVAFLDSDDYVDSNMYAVMIKEIKAKEADLVTCGYYHVVGDTLERYSYNNETIENPRLLANKLVGEQRMASAVWNNLFKKSIIDEHDLRFKDISVGEDLLFLMEYLLVCKTTVRLQECYYYYVANSNSITHRLGVNDKDSLLKLLPLKYEVFERHNLIDKQFNADKRETVAFRRRRLHYLRGGT